MTKKPVTGRIISLLTAVLTMTVMCLPASAFAANGITKDETVYVVTDSSGTQQDVIVSDHLINKGKVKTIEDKTNLQDIENVKGEETFKQDGESLTWDAEGNGIYYQGRSEDEIPVAMDIIYRLNDKVVTGSELQGQSGKVEIKINYTNDAEFEGTTVPFVVMTGMVITDDSFKNIQVTKGKVIDDGDKLMVVGMAAPGLAQTLDIGESDLGIGSSVTITGDADKFAVEDMMTVVTNSFFEDIDTGKIDDLDYDDEIKELDKGAKALADGSDALYEGLNKLDESMPTLQEGVQQLADGSDALATGTNEAKKGAKKIAKGSKELSDQLTKELKGMQPKAKEGTLGAKFLYQGLYVMKNGDGTAKNPGVIASLGNIKGGIDSVSAQSEYIKTKGQEALGSAGTVVEKNTSAVQNIEAAEAAAEAIKTTDPETYNTIINSLNKAKTDIQDSTSATNDMVKDIYNNDAENSNPDYNSILEYNGVISATSQALSPGVSELREKLDTALGDTSKGNEETLIGGSYALWKGLENMQKKIDKNLDKDGDLMKGLRKLTKGSGDLEEGEKELASGASRIANGMSDLNDKSGELIDGVDKLDNGAYKLRKGMSELYNQGIKKIVDLYNDDLKGTLDSADAMMDAGKGYKTFTRLPSGMDGSVKFIYKTDMTN